ncbi:hypothetical protein Hanom_Chr09g00772921 [Helianthus anomalus]
MKNGILKKTTDNTHVADPVEVTTEIEFTESFDNAKSTDKIDENDFKSETKTEVQCRKCMKTCNTCTEKDENLRSRNIEFTKIEYIFKEKCIEMLENEKFLKQKEEELTQKCDSLKKENKVLR